MPLSLHAAVVPSMLQILGAVGGLVGKAAAHCSERGLPAQTLIQARLAPDMHPFAYQVKSVAVHSAGALAGALAGSFSPDMTTPPDSFAGLSDKVEEARAALATITPDELERLVGQPVVFTIGEKFRRDFVAEEFLLSFSQPNFYFHATTAYDILRAEGVSIGKIDYLGAMRVVQR